ncbi:MAG TPA: PTS sugar transporter subunit IIA [Planctomycetota bacterium]|nr:PTS sugar transporter subunit IIA [Planctomycetota bacterium]
MNVLRFLHPECIKLDLETHPSEAVEGETDAQRDKRRQRDKDHVLEELADLFDRSGLVINRSKFLRDLTNRERKATTAVAPGIAIPHVRTLQVRAFVMGFARAPGEGIPFDSLDGEPTKLFFLLASPPYDDRTYLTVYRELAQLIQDENTFAALHSVHVPQNVFNVLRGFFVR